MILNKLLWVLAQHRWNFSLFYFTFYADQVNQYHAKYCNVGLIILLLRWAFTLILQIAFWNRSIANLKTSQPIEEYISNNCIFLAILYSDIPGSMFINFYHLKLIDIISAICWRVLETDCVGTSLRCWRPICDFCDDFFTAGKVTNIFML